MKQRSMMIDSATESSFITSHNLKYLYKASHASSTSSISESSSSLKFRTLAVVDRSYRRPWVLGELC